jgi:hypothetical protein
LANGSAWHSHRITDVSAPTFLTRRQFVLAAICLAALILTQQIVGSFGNSELGQAIHNAMHFPWSMLVSFTVWLMFRRLSGSETLGIAYAVFAALIVAAATELAQVFTQRFASLTDFLLNALGIGTTFCLIWVVSNRQNAFVSILVIVAEVVCVAFAFAPVAYQGAIRLHLNTKMPDLIDLDSTLGRTPIKFTDRIRLHTAQNHQQAVEVRFDGGKWSGITLKNFVPDWSNYSELVLQTRLISTKPAAINIRLGFDRGNGPIHSYMLLPGKNQINLPFADNNLNGRIPSVRAIILYAANGQAAGSVLFLNRVFLE